MTDPPEQPEEQVPAETVADINGLGDNRVRVVPGDHIGLFKVIRALGEGGFGAVYLCEQSEPVRRQVAIKIIKPGMDSNAIIARFEAERQALALMNHSSIARVFEAGATEEGRPYFVMEYVKGIPITEYCDQNTLSTRDRLALFAKVCDGVQHAHQKGIIHRDLKPGNILVTSTDRREPQPKIIDFGIAKATSQQLTEKTIFTQLGQMIGTPEYMSPEQADLNSEDVDTRTDVYSLGVVLYELLSGRLPFDPGDLRSKGYAEIQRIIREDDPPKPSTRLTTVSSTDQSTATRIAKLRRTSIESLSNALRRELEWIPLKALRKNRAERYDSATALADDVRRYLSGEALEAGPESTGYRLRKLLKRNKGPVTAAVIVLLVLVAGVVTTSIAAFEASSQSARANKAAQENLALAIMAEEEAERLAQVVEFQSTLLSDVDPQVMGTRLRRNLLEQIDPELRPAFEDRLASVNFTDLGVGALRADVLEPAVLAINASFDEQPEVRATLLQSVATTARIYGLYTWAERHQQAALDLREQHLEPGDSQVLDSIAEWASLAGSLGRYEAMRSAHERALRSASPGSLASITHRNGIALASGNLGELEDAEQLHRSVLADAQHVLPKDDPLLQTLKMNLGGVLDRMGKYPQAKAQYQQAFSAQEELLGADHPSTLASAGNLASVLATMGEFTEAVELQRDVLERQQRALGENHPTTLSAAYNLAWSYDAMGQYEQAEAMHRSILDERRELFGAGHPQTLSSMKSHGSALIALGRLDEAEPLYQEALQRSIDSLGKRHPDTLGAMNNMGFFYGRMGRFDQGLPYHVEVLELSREVMGDEHPETMSAMGNLAYVLGELARHAEAEPLAREVLEHRISIYGEVHPDTALGHGNLGALLETLGQWEEAETHSLAALSIFEQTLGPDNARTIIARSNHAMLLEDTGRAHLAEPMFIEVHEAQLRVLGPDHPHSLTGMAKVAMVWEGLGRYEESEAMHRRVLEARRRVLGADHPDVGNTLNNLGLMLGLRLERHEEADAMLLEAISIATRALGAEHPSTVQSHYNLARLLVDRQLHEQALAHFAAYERGTLARHESSSHQAQAMYETLANFHSNWHEADPTGGHDRLATSYQARLDESGSISSPAEP